MLVEKCRRVGIRPIGVQSQLVLCSVRRESDYVRLGLPPFPLRNEKATRALPARRTRANSVG